MGAASVVTAAGVLGAGSVVTAADCSVITAADVLGTGPDGDWLTSISSLLVIRYDVNGTRQISANVLISFSLVRCRKRPRTSTVTAFISCGLMMQ